MRYKWSVLVTIFLEHRRGFDSSFFESFLTPAVDEIVVSKTRVHTQSPRNVAFPKTPTLP